MKFWDIIVTEQPVTVDFLKENEEKIDWTLFSERGYITKDIVEAFPILIDMLYVSRNEKVTSEFLLSVEKDVYWHVLWMNRNITETLLSELEAKVNWSLVSKNIVLSLDIIEKYAPLLEWKQISKHNLLLTEDFVEKHADKVDWYYISKRMKLSQEFIQKHKDRLVQEGLEQNRYIEQY